MSNAWADAVKKGYLRASFNRTLRDRLITVDEKDTYEDFCHQVKGIAIVTGCYPGERGRGLVRTLKPILNKNATDENGVFMKSWKEMTSIKQAEAVRGAVAAPPF
jgi:hypothetical protein